MTDVTLDYRFGAKSIAQQLVGAGVVFEAAAINQMTWKTIDTAPKDGTIVLVCHDQSYKYAPESAFYGVYHPNSQGKHTWRSVSNSTKILVTHWMELPEKPNK